jgi:23S rRNA (cytidine1920-2'-O)/16S rRNA (cytidine1409-2'-O)-methyltransferase
LSSLNTSGPPSKPSASVKEDEHKYVSRGGHKLRGALDYFQIDAKGRICLDVGSSTGGFTDCLLQAGAKSVWAVDVGYGLFDYTLKKDPRVHLLERTNFRYLNASALTETPDVVTVDVSFIALAKILPKIAEVLANGGHVLAMVKPQFEGTPKEVPGGFVRDEKTRQLILERTKHVIEAAGFKILGQQDSAVKGRKGNQETFLHLVR